MWNLILFFVKFDFVFCKTNFTHTRFIYTHIYTHTYIYDRNLCQDTCFLSGVKNKIFTNQKATSKADMMNLNSVTIGACIHNISTYRYVYIPYAKLLFLNCACFQSFSKIYPGFAAILLWTKQDAWGVSCSLTSSFNHPFFTKVLSTLIWHPLICSDMTPANL